MALQDLSSQWLQGASSSPLLVVVALTAIFAICVTQLRVTVHPNEPLLLNPRVPFIGHIIGLVKGKCGYLGDLG